MSRQRKNPKTVKAATKATATPTDAPQTVATPTRPETVTEQVRREAAEEAEAERAKLAAEREKREAEEAERRAKAEAERRARAEAAKLAEQRRRAYERAQKVAKAHRIRASHAAIVARAESTYVHLDKMLAAMLAYDNDSKAGKADGLGPFERDFVSAMETLASMKSDYRQYLLSNADLIGRCLGWKRYRAELAAIAEGEAIEREDAAKEVA